MFWNVKFIYNAFIRTTGHCKVQTALMIDKFTADIKRTKTSICCLIDVLLQY